MTKNELISMAKQLNVELPSKQTVNSIYDAITDAGYFIGVDNRTGDWIALNKGNVCASVA